jgi:hypothetical protein
MNGWRLWVYFKRGHSGFLNLIIAFLNFATIQYNLVVAQVPWLGDMFRSQLAFMGFFVSAYFLVACAVGWFDMGRRGSLIVEQERSAVVNPFVKDQADVLLYLLNEDDSEEVKALKTRLRRWT